MIEAGANALDERTAPDVPQTYNPTYAAETVYRAMEKVRLAIA